PGKLYPIHAGELPLALLGWVGEREGRRRVGIALRAKAVGREIVFQAAGAALRRRRLDLQPVGPLARGRAIREQVVAARVALDALGDLLERLLHRLRVGLDDGAGAADRAQLVRIDLGAHANRKDVEGGFVDRLHHLVARDPTRAVGAVREDDQGA